MSELFHKVMSHIDITGIAAITANDVLGVGGELAIQDSRDLSLFKRLTMGKILVMGRKTVDSLPRKLLGRVVICLTGDRSYQSKKADYVVHSLDELAVFLVENSVSEIWVAGGASVYSLFEGYYNQLYITHFNESVPEDNAIKLDTGILVGYSKRSKVAGWKAGMLVKYEF